jgi:hypothetical protein
MKEVAILKNAREGRIKERGSDDFRGAASGGLNLHRRRRVSPELRAEND